MSAAQGVDDAALTTLLRTVSERARQDNLFTSVFERVSTPSGEVWAELQNAWALLLRADANASRPEPKPSMLEPRALGRWLAIFHGACAELLEPAAANALSEKAERIAARLEPRLFIGHANGEA